MKAQICCALLVGVFSAGVKAPTMNPKEGPQSCIPSLSVVDGTRNVTMRHVRERFMRRGTQHKFTTVPSRLCQPFSKRFVFLLPGSVPLRWESLRLYCLGFPLLFTHYWRGGLEGEHPLSYSVLFRSTGRLVNILTDPFHSSRPVRWFSSIEHTVATACVWLHHPTSGVAVKIFFPR